MVRIYKGDTYIDFITIERVELPESASYTISKAIFECGKIRKEFENPVFPLKITLTKQDTMLCEFKNVGYLGIVDSEGNHHTCNGYVAFEAVDGVINYGG